MHDEDYAVMNSHKKNVDMIKSKYVILSGKTSAVCPKRKAGFPAETRDQIWIATVLPAGRNAIILI